MPTTTLAARQLAAAINALLTGYTSGPGTLASTDSILAAIQKLNGNDGRVFLGNGTATNAATVAISFASWYNLFQSIEIVVDTILPITNTVNLVMTTSPDGSTFDTGSTAYGYAIGYVNNAGSGNVGNAGFSSGASSILLAGSLSNATGGGTTSMKLTLFNTGNASNWATIGIDVYVASNSTTIAKVYGTGTRMTAAVVKAVRLNMSSGNMSCNYRIYGCP